MGPLAFGGTGSRLAPPRVARGGSATSLASLLVGLVCALLVLVPATPAGAARPGPRRATWVQGDSVMTGAVADVQAALAGDGWQATVTGFPGLQTWAAVGLFRQVRPRMGSVAVVELGNNDCCDAASFGRQIDKVMRALAGLDVIWLTDAPFRPQEGSVNAAIRAAAGRWPNLTVADWGGVVAANPGLVYPDGLHLTEAGKAAIAGFIRQTLDHWYSRYYGPDAPLVRAAGSAPAVGPQGPALFRGAVAAAAPARSGAGYWVASTAGEVLAYGAASWHGSPATAPDGRHRLAAPVAGMAATPDGGGYWLAGTDGAVVAFGDAHLYGSASSVRLSAPIVAMAATRDGRGYWLVGSDGGVFSFGDAGWFGSAAGTDLAAPVVGLAPTPDGRGYWLAGADGGVQTFGDARFFGSAAEGSARRSPVESVAAAPDGAGYWLLRSDGVVVAFGDAASLGPRTAGPAPGPPRGDLETPEYRVLVPPPEGGGYWVVGEDPDLQPDERPLRFC